METTTGSNSVVDQPTLHSESGPRTQINNWKDILATKASHLVEIKQKRRLITINCDMPIKEALTCLSMHQILSAPVVDKDKFLGHVDVLDIVGFAISVWRQQQLHLYRQEFDPQQKFFDTPIRDVVNFSMWNYPVNVTEDATIGEILDVMNNPSRHFHPHRIGILDSQTIQLKSLLSQSDIIRFFADNIHAIPNSTKKLKDIRLYHTAVLVRIDSYLSDALIHLYSNRLSGIALIDNNGHLSGNLSASDLRGILPEAFDMFNQSTLAFLAKGTTSRTRAPITCTPESTLEDVIRTLVKEKVHRIYVTTGTEVDALLGVITLSDIIQFVKPAL